MRAILALVFRALAPAALVPIILTTVTLPTAARAAPPQIVADIPPVAALVAMVLGDADGVSTLLPPGASPHDYALKPSDARALAAADIVVWIGPSLTPNLARPMANLAPHASRLDLSAIPGVHRLPARDSALFDTGAHDHDHDHGHDADTPFDPHLWLDPDNATLWLDTLRATITAADPDNAATYSANAAAARTALEEAAMRARATLAGADRPLAALHDGFQYFEAAFGLTTLGALTASDDASPSPKRLATLRDALPPGTCLLVAPQYDPRLVSALGADIHAVEIDTLGAALPPDAAFYPALLHDLATRIAACAKR
ncbi:zinc ABC transporter substrate-binding protein [Roseivivax sp. CAU 1753]